MSDLQERVLARIGTWAMAAGARATFGDGDKELTHPMIRALAALRAIIEAHRCPPFPDILDESSCPIDIAARELGVE